MSSFPVTIGAGDYKNTWMIIHDKNSNEFEITDTYARKKFSTRVRDLRYIGKFDQHYHLVLPGSGYTFIYAEPSRNGQDMSGKLLVVDPRWNGILYIARCGAQR